MYITMPDEPNIHHLRFQCPCCGTMVKSDRIGKDYDLKAFQLNFKGYKKIEWVDVSNTGRGFKEFWISVMVSALKRLGYNFQKSPIIRERIIHNYDFGSEKVYQPNVVRERIVDLDVEVNL